MLEASAPKFVSAAEITRNFGMWQDRAGQGPLIVTHHGRPRVVLLGVEEYQAMARPPGGDPAGDDSSRLAMVGEQLGACFAAFDGQLRFTRLNTLAGLHFGRPAGALVGKALVEIDPALADGPIVAALEQVVASGEALRLDAPSHAQPGRLLRLRLFPFPEGVAALFHDVAGEVRARREAAEREALFAAREAHGAVGVARLSLRATFEMIEPGFARIAGFAPARLAGVRLADLLALGARAATNDEIERVLGQGEARSFASRLLVNGASERAVTLSLAPVREGFGIVGAVALMSGADTRASVERDGAGAAGGGSPRDGAAAPSCVANAVETC